MTRIDPSRLPEASELFWKRFAAFLIDGCILWLPGLYMVGRMPNLWVNVISILLGFAYFGLLEGFSPGATLGKRVMKLRVVGADGQPIGPGRAMYRHVARYASALLLLWGYWSMLSSPTRQTLHDKLADAYVVPAEE